MIIYVLSWHDNQVRLFEESEHHENGAWRLAGPSCSPDLAEGSLRCSLTKASTDASFLAFFFFLGQSICILKGIKVLCKWANSTLWVRDLGRGKQASQGSPTLFTLKVLVSHFPSRESEHNWWSLKSAQNSQPLSSHFLNISTHFYKMSYEFCKLLHATHDCFKITPVWSKTSTPRWFKEKH